MTKFKDYVRSKGLRLEEDFDCLPCDGIECVVVVPENARVSYYYVGAGWMHWLFNKYGTIRTFRTADEERNATAMAVHFLRRRGRT